MKLGDVFEFTMKTKNSFGYSLFSGGSSDPKSTATQPPPYQFNTIEDIPGRVSLFGPPELTGI